MNQTQREFSSRVEANGIALKNVPNAHEEDGLFYFSDYVARDPMTWGMVPTDPDSIDTEAVADDVFEPYEDLEYYDEIDVTRYTEEMHWCDVVVEIPADSSRAERLAEAIADAVFDRQHS